MAWFGLVWLLTRLGLDRGLESEVDVCKSMLAADSNESQSFGPKRIPIVYRKPYSLLPDLPVAMQRGNRRKRAHKSVDLPDQVTAV
jgi:hypothetical protein